MLRRTYPNRNGAMLLGVHFARLYEVFTGLDVHGYVMISNDDCTLGTCYNRERKVRKSEPVCVCVLATSLSTLMPREARKGGSDSKKHNSVVSINHTPRDRFSISH